MSSERWRDGGADEIPLPAGPGRLWLCGKHYVGPDPEAALARVDATTIVCLTEVHELAERYPGYVTWLGANQPQRALWHPIPDLHAPSAEHADVLIEELRRRLASGETLLVHCGAGIGRAGTVAAAVLMAMGVAMDDAVTRVRSHRPMAGPEAGAQAELLELLERRRPA